MNLDDLKNLPTAAPSGWDTFNSHKKKLIEGQA